MFRSFKIVVWNLKLRGFDDSTKQIYFQFSSIAKFSVTPKQWIRKLINLISRATIHFCHSFSRKSYVQLESQPSSAQIEVEGVARLSGIVCIYAVKLSCLLLHLKGFYTITPSYIAVIIWIVVSVCALKVEISRLKQILQKCKMPKAASPSFPAWHCYIENRSTVENTENFLFILTDKCLSQGQY